MKFLKAVAAAAILGFTIGCSGGPADNPVEVAAPAAVDDIKMVLNEVIENGNPLGSQGYTLEMKIDELGQTDAAKAEKLKAAYLELRDMTKAGELKSKAKEMLGML